MKEITNIKRFSSFIKSLLIFVLAYVFSISTVFSQNSGPNAPEVMGFEPVDVTDVVNLATGSFTYTLPVMNIPGSYGGFPVVLAYHSGISSDQEASWVGLGWSLSVGAINRSVNGICDDYKQKEIVAGLSHMPNEVITNNYLEINFSPLQDPSILGLGIRYNWGAYQGFGGSVSVGGLGKSGSGYIKAGFYTDDTRTTFYGEVNGVSAYVNSDGTGGVGFGAVITASDNSIGISMKSAGNITAALSAASSSMEANVDVEDTKAVEYVFHDWEFAIPTPWVTIAFGSSKKMYNFYNFSEKSLNGVLYFDELGYDGLYSDSDVLMDVISDDYLCESRDWSYRGTTISGNSSLSPAYDTYSVSGQGMGGVVSPKLLYSGLLYGESMSTDWFSGSNITQEEVKYLVGNNGSMPKFSASSKAEFYFNNSSSSFYNVNPGVFEDQNNGTTNLDMVYYNPGATESTINGEATYSSEKTRLKTGKVVEWFTNTQIRNGEAKSKGFIENGRIYESRKAGDFYDYFDPDGIGGFMITDIDGKTYHYSIPVYQLESYSIKTGGLKPDNVAISRNPNKYAYTWLLTGITGPDYIDGNSNGKIDDGDYGYWVSMDYGKWSDGYFWHLPYVEEKDKPQNMGFKQVYYLDAIETNTHKAYFLKSEREDALSKTKFNTYTIETTPGHGIQHFNDYDMCGFRGCHNQSLVVSKRYKYPDLDCNSMGPFSAWWLLSIDVALRNENHIFSVVNQTKTLKLDKIILVDKKKSLSIDRTSIDPIDVGFVRVMEYIDLVEGSVGIKGDALRDHYDHVGTGAHQFCKDKEYRAHNYSMFYNNIFHSDFFSEEFLKTVPLKTVNFNYDYSLCPGTPNSNADGKGKLSLESVSFMGKNSNTILPPYSFSYIKDDNISFNLKNRDDWGFDVNNPAIWSLDKITTPIGTDINVEYEANEYIKESSVNELNYYVKGEYGVAENIAQAGCANTYAKKITLVIPEKYDLEKLFDSEPNFTFQGSFKGQINGHDANRTAILDATFESINYNTRSLVFTACFQRYFSDFFTAQGYDCTHLSKVTDYTLKIPASTPVEGSGIRVRSLQVSDGITDQGKDVYEYNTGVTSYSPGRYGSYHIPFVDHQPAPRVYYGSVSHKRLDKNGDQVINTLYNFKVPNPTTDMCNEQYKHGDIIKVSDIQDDYQGHGKKLFSENASGTNGWHVREVFARSMVIEINNNAIGRINSIIHKNANNEEIGKKVYDYYDINEIPNGIIGETFQNYKKYVFWHSNNTSHNWFQFNSTTIVEHPSILKSVTTTSNLGSVTESYGEFDILTGNALSTTVKKGDRTIKNKVIPAYHISNYNQTGGMGSKVENSDNKNMLTQEAVNISYELIGGEWEVLGVGIQTWKGTWSNYIGNEVTNDIVGVGFNSTGTDGGHNIWRKHKSFVWQGDLDSEGTYSGFGYNTETIKDIPCFTDANYSGSPKGENGWKMTEEIVRYNHYSSPLEFKDINGDFTSLKKDPEDLYTIAQAGNSPYLCFTATGFEYLYGGQFAFEGEVCGYGNSIIKNEDQQGEVIPHSGECCISLNNIYYNIKKDASFVYGKYRASYWLHKNSLSEPQLLVNSAIIAHKQYVGLFGDWKLYYVDFNLSGNDAQYKVELQKTGGVSYIDDFRVAPFSSNLTSYTYDESGNVTAIINNDNFATKYEYDVDGRLEAVYTETLNGFKKVKEHNYGYSYEDPTGITCNQANVEIVEDTHTNSICEVSREIRNEGQLTKTKTLTFKIGDEVKTVTKNIPPLLTEEFTASLNMVPVWEGTKILEISGDCSKNIYLNKPEYFYISDVEVFPHNEKHPSILPLPVRCKITGTSNKSNIWVKFLITNIADPNNIYAESDIIHFSLVNGYYRLDANIDIPIDFGGIFNISVVGGLTSFEDVDYVKHYTDVLVELQNNNSSSPNTSQNTSGLIRFDDHGVRVQLYNPKECEVDYEWIVTSGVNCNNYTKGAPAGTSCNCNSIAIPYSCLNLKYGDYVEVNIIPRNNCSEPITIGREYTGRD